MSLPNPYEIILHFNSVTGEQFTTRSPKAKVKRSKNGCFNCRKRKKKCDEIKPSCSSCTSRCITCIWPKNSKEKLPRSFNIPDSNKDQLKKSTPLIKKFVHVNFNQEGPSDDLSIDENLFQQLRSFETSFLSPPSMKSSSFNQMGSPNVQIVANTELLDPESEDLTDLFTPGSLQNRMIISLNIEENFKNACINEFITSVGPQYTHPLLTTSATFLPFIRNNPLMEEIASACGCAYLSWSDPSLNQLARKKYGKALSLMYKTFDSLGSDTTRDQIWFCAGWQLLCLCSKVIPTKAIRNTHQILNMSYKAVKQIISASEKGNNKLTFSHRKIKEQELYLKDFTHNSTDTLKMEIENSLIPFEDTKKNSSYLTKHSERMFVESFIYHYSVNVLVASNEDDFPNPFHVFSNYGYALKTPLFSCDVAWMNNPVCGPGFDSYELAAKASYLIRHLDDPKTFPIANKLLDIATFSTPPMIPFELRPDTTKYATLKDSVLIGEVVMRAAKILLMKIIDIDLDSTDPLIQKEVEIVLKKLQQTTKNSRCKVISTWALFVCGTACVTDEQQKIILDNCLEVCQITHNCSMFSIFRALDICWGRDTTHYLRGRGIDVLLDGDFLSEITL